MSIPKDLIKECKKRLVECKEDLINRSRHHYSEYRNNEFRGDEVDQTLAVLAEKQFLLNQSRLRQQITEVEAALGRIERGTFGRCEETEEYIETERLLAIPWTRLSIEGAEIRESMNKRYARQK